ncbi:MAG: hypothetical protein ACE5F1_14415, partial [Planctomycetota bacterium]
MNNFTKFALLPLASLTLAGLSSARSIQRKPSQLQLLETTEVFQGNTAHFLRYGGQLDRDTDAETYAFLILGTSSIDYQLPGGAHLTVMPELIVALGAFSSLASNRIGIPNELPVGIFAQILVMRADGARFWVSNR